MISNGYGVVVSVNFDNMSSGASIGTAGMVKSDKGLRTTFGIYSKKKTR